MRFKDRSAAGQFLAGQLIGYTDRPDVIVLALPRGGVPVGFEVAAALHVPLDICLVRKLGVPDQPELAMGAIASGGVKVLNRDILQKLRLSDAVIQQVADQELQELQRREQLYRNDRPSLDLRDRTVILVDDGLATGATMRAAVKAVQQQAPAQIVIAVPVASAETCEAFRAEVDDVICAVTPESFASVGAWYENFAQTTDAEVEQLLQQPTSNSPPSSPQCELTYSPP